VVLTVGLSNWRRCDTGVRRFTVRDSALRPSRMTETQSVELALGLQSFLRARCAGSRLTSTRFRTRCQVGGRVTAGTSGVHSYADVWLNSAVRNRTRNTPQLNFFVFFEKNEDNTDGQSGGGDVNFNRSAWTACNVAVVLALFRFVNNSRIAPSGVCPERPNLSNCGSVRPGACIVVVSGNIAFHNQF